MFGTFISFSVRSFVICLFREMNVIDNQRLLNQLSNKLEPRQS